MDVARILRRASAEPLSDLVLYRQLILMGRVARAHTGSPLRQDTFVDNTLQPQVGRFVRKVGRPRQEWTTEVMKAGAGKFGNWALFENLVQSCDAKQWKCELDRRFRR